MKNNQPVTNNEQPFPKGLYLVSKTDLNGTITHVNNAFVAISGFTREELVGGSHNMVRHPDMPPQAFQDLWKTIKAGYPWQGLVKNRCKNGDYYWVKAFVIPIKRDDQIIGYMSVRSEASRSEIEEATRVYGALRQSHAKFDTQPPWLERLSMKFRLTLLMAFVLVLIVIGSIIGVGGQKQSNQDLREAYEGHLTPAVAIARMVERMGDNRSQIMLGLQHSPDNRYHTQHDHQVQAHIDATLKNREMIESLRKDYEQAKKDEVEQALSRAFFDARDRFSQDGVNPAREALKVGDFDKAQVLLLTKINPLYKDVASRAEALQDHLAQEGRNAYLEADQRYENTKNISIGGTILAIVFVSLAGWLLIRSMSKKMRSIIHHCGRMSQGDLSEAIDTAGRDEAGQALTELASMQVSLKVMIDEIQTASHQIEDESKRVEWQTSNVVNQSEQQRDKASSVASATEEFAQSVTGVSDSAANTARSASSSQQQVIIAQNSMQKSIDATVSVVNAVQRSSGTIQELNVAIAKIGDITNTIREIADQTNLLALNAAIEAARAGETGRGFAVVADEVRKLAERTANSTVDISNNVGDIRRVTDTAVASMAEAVQKVEDGVGLIRESGAGLSDITESSHHVTEMAQDIASAAKEQVLASQLVTQNMEQVVALVDGNLEAATEAKAAVTNLVKTADYLNRIVGRFKVSS